MKNHYTIFRKLFTFVTLVLFAGQALAQVPTTADCLGAIPICQNTYSYSQSPSGTGNYPTEIDNLSSCLGSGELNDTWYTFTVQQSGNLNFLITPNNLSDDYDWAVYNLSNNNCSDIYGTPGLEVSCNFSGTGGTTGPNGGSSSTSQNASGTPYNAVIPVVAGQTYVVNISNYSSTTSGYTIDFGQSTAVIFDQVPPQILTVTGPGCSGGSTVTVTFSENILCNTVQTGDFTLTGPGGPYTVTNVTSAACATGGTYDNTYTITISPAISTGGTFTMNLVGPVTDLCGNVAIFPASLTFNIGSLTLTTTSTAAQCGQQNGSATVTVSGGTTPYTFSWNTTPPQNTATASSIGAGSYTVTVNDAAGCSSTATVTVAAQGSTSISIASQTNPVCNGQCTGTATVNGSGGPAPYTYSWNTTPIQTSATATGLCAGSYVATVTDAQGCTATQTVTITQPNLLALATNTVSATCGQPNGQASVTAQGGTGPFTYAWSTTPAQTSASATGLIPGQYTVTVTDANGCNQTAVAIISNQSSLNTSILSYTDVTCDAITCDGTATADALGGTAPYTYAWSTTPPQSNVTATGLCAGTYTVAIADANGCAGTANVTISECPPPPQDFTFYAPNTFTPNGDGKNDVFQGKGTYIQEYHMMVFDRWGNLIWKTDDLNEWWDGTVQTKDLVQQDVYVYVVNLTDYYNKKHKFIGHVSMIK